MWNDMFIYFFMCIYIALYIFISRFPRQTSGVLLFKSPQNSVRRCFRLPLSRQACYVRRQADDKIDVLMAGQPTPLIRPYDQGLWKPLVSLDKAGMKNPYFVSGGTCP